jgi:hypothetical protein
MPVNSAAGPRSGSASAGRVTAGFAAVGAEDDDGLACRAGVAGTMIVGASVGAAVGSGVILDAAVGIIAP